MYKEYRKIYYALLPPLREESRALHLVYGYLRGRSYQELEPNVGEKDLKRHQPIYLRALSGKNAKWLQQMHMWDNIRHNYAVLRRKAQAALEKLGLLEEDESLDWWEPWILAENWDRGEIEPLVGPLWDLQTPDVETQKEALLFFGDYDDGSLKFIGGAAVARQLYDLLKSRNRTVAQYAAVVLCQSYGQYGVDLVKRAVKPSRHRVLHAPLVHGILHLLGHEEEDYYAAQKRRRSV